MRFQLPGYEFSDRHSPPPHGTVGRATCPFRVGFRLFVSPPASMVACARVLMLVSLVLAPVLSFNSPFSVSPPPATLAVRGRFFTVVCIITVSAFPSILFLPVLPGFIAKPFRGVGVGFEEPHLLLMF